MQGRIEPVPGGEAVRFPMLERPGVTALFTTRHGGNGVFNGLNWSYMVGDQPESVAANRRLSLGWLAEPAAGAEPLAVVGSLEHGNRVLAIGPAEAAAYGQGVEQQPVPFADGLITREVGVALAVTCADCVPVYLYDPVQRAIGLCHAGWRGTVAGAASATVQAMADHYGSAPAELLAVVGPSIGPCCFEVDAAVADPLRARYGHHPGLLTDGPAPGKWQADLWEANRADLLQAGLRAEHIAVAGLCTSCRTDLFFSHRAQRGKTGRQAALLMLQPEVRRQETGL